MYQAIHYNENGAMADRLSYLQRHDIVYRRPALRPYDGLPVGTGDSGGLLYQSAYGLEMTVNHADALDYAPDGPMSAWAWEAEEHQTVPVSCGHLSIRASMPIFDWVYLEKFEQRLMLAAAEITGRAETPFSTAAWKVYAPQDPGVLAVEFTIRCDEPVELDILMDKWPSPHFIHHYEQILHTHNERINTVKTHAHDDRILVTQDLGRCKTALAATCQGSAEIVNSHAARFRFPRQTEHAFTLYVAARAEETDDAARNAMLALDSITDAHSIREKHRARWRTFWNQSFIHLQENDYLENLYYIHLYQLGCSSLGRNPLTFAGLWGWFRDSRNWGHFYHWNHQQTYWGLHAAGHSELLANYLDYRFRMLPHAKEDAKRLFGVDGAFYSDISNLNGCNAIEPDTVRNLSVGLQIALDFYRHVRYTMDTAFLKEKALPVMTACADLYLNLMQEREGKLYLRGGSTPLESYWNLALTLPDQVLLRSVLRALMDVSEAYTLGLPVEHYRDVLEHLPPLPTETVSHNGEELEIFSAGVSWDGRTVPYAGGEYPLSPFPATLFSPVWPGEWIGLGKESEREFAVMRNTARVIFDRDVYGIGALGCCGHSPSPETAARLGMTEDMEPILHRFIRAYQLFPNGLMHFSDVTQNQQWSQIDRPQILPENISGTQWEKMHEKDFGDRTEIPSEWFLHCYFEAAANLFAGTQDMLLQSQNGLIRVFPALPQKRTAMFTLWAEGGFQVTSECTDGDIRYISIVSTKAGVCRVLLPWNAPVGIRCGNADIAFEQQGDTVVFTADAGQRYLLYRREFPPENYYHNSFPNVENQGRKTFDRAVIGLAAYY